MFWASYAGPTGLYVPMLCWGLQLWLRSLLLLLLLRRSHGCCVYKEREGEKIRVLEEKDIFRRGPPGANAALRKSWKEGTSEETRKERPRTSLSVEVPVEEEECMLMTDNLGEVICFDADMSLLPAF